MSQKGTVVGPFQDHPRKHHFRTCGASKLAFPSVPKASGRAPPSCIDTALFYRLRLRGSCIFMLLTLPPTKPSHAPLFLCIVRKGFYFCEIPNPARIPKLLWAKTRMGQYPDRIRDCKTIGVHSQTIRFGPPSVSNSSILVLRSRLGVNPGAHRQTVLWSL